MRFWCFFGGHYVELNEAGSMVVIDVNSMFEADDSLLTLDSDDARKMGEYLIKLADQIKVGAIEGL